MKCRLLWLIGLTLAVAAPVFGQINGSVGVTGRIPAVYSISNGSNSATTVTLRLGVQQKSASLKLRTNAAYKLTVQVSSVDLGASAGEGSDTNATLNDIGFGVTAVEATGANVVTGHYDTILSGYDASQGWTKTLADIAYPTQILSGSRISARGNLSTNDNFVLVTVGVATLSQYLTQNPGFSATVTLTITPL